MAKLDFKNAIYNVVSATLDMGDYIDDIAEYVSEIADYEFDEDEDDMKKVFMKSIASLIKNKSEELVDFLSEYFEEDINIEYLLDYIDSSEFQLVPSINMIYSKIGSFPNGSKIRDAIEKNIFNNSDFAEHFSKKESRGTNMRKLYLSEGIGDASLQDLKKWVKQQFDNPYIDGCSWLPIIDNLNLVCYVEEDEDNGNLVWHFKVAYNDSSLQSDYDFDWYMPYDDYGEVWDTDMTFESMMSEWYMKQYYDQAIKMSKDKSLNTYKMWNDDEEDFDDDWEDDEEF